MINSATGEKIIRKIFKKAVVVKINFYKHGIINKNYEIKITNPDKEFILRIYPKHDWKAEKERYVYDLISHHIKIPIPKIYLIDDSKKLINYSYAILSKIYGVELDKAYKKTGNKNLLTIAGEYLAKIHSIKMPAFGWITNNGISPKFKRWTDFLEYDLDEKLTKLSKVKIFQKDIITQSRIYFSRNREQLEILDKPCLLHKDYHFSHILSDGNKITGIIDVEWAIAGHNELDIAKSLMWMFDKKPELGRLFIKGYKKYGKISKSFYIRKPIYDFLILISSLSLAYEYNNIKWVKEHMKKLRKIISQTK